MTPSTADLVLSALQPYEVKREPNGQYRCNSPLRPGSNSHGFTVRIDGPEHGAFKDHVSDEGGSLYTLAEKLGIRQPGPQAAAPNVPSTKRTYAGLAEYAAAHYSPRSAMLHPYAGLSPAKRIAMRKTCVLRLARYRAVGVYTRSRRFLPLQCGAKPAFWAEWFTP